MPPWLPLVLHAPCASSVASQTQISGRYNVVDMPSWSANKHAAKDAMGCSGSVNTARARPKVAAVGLPLQRKLFALTRRHPNLSPNPYKITTLALA